MSSILNRLLGEGDAQPEIKNTRELPQFGDASAFAADLMRAVADIREAAASIARLYERTANCSREVR